MNNGSAIDWGEVVVDLVRSQKWVMGLTALAIVLGAVVIAFQWPPTYQATASILMQGPGSRGLLSGAGGRGDAMSKEDLSSELEILRSPDLLKITVQAVHESEAPAAAPVVGAAAQPVDLTQPRRVSLPVDMAMLLRQLEETSRATTSDEAVDDLDAGLAVEKGFLRRLEQPLEPELEEEWQDIKDRLDVQLLPATKVIRFTLTGHDAERTEQVLDAYINQYLLYRAHLFNPADQERFFSERTQFYKQRIEVLENQLLEQARITAVVHPETEIQSNLELKREQIRQLNTLDDERIQSEFISDPTLEARIREIQDRIRDIDDVNLQLQEEIVERQRIARESTLGEFSYKLFSQRQEEDRMQRAIAAAKLSGDVTILSRAALTARLVFPRPRQVLAVGLVAALFAGFALGCLNEFLDDTFKRERDIVRHAGLPVVLSIRKTRNCP